MGAQALGVLASFVLIYTTVVFFIYLKVRRLDIADAAWGGIFIGLALVSYGIGRAGFLQLLTTLLVCIWGSRLSYYIVGRLRNTREDARYVAMRARWKGSEVTNAYVRVFLAQGILGTIIALVVVVINLSAVTQVGVIAYMGIAVWVVGFLFESIGDAQLKKYLRDPRHRGTIMTAGLWRYTRHPNYFGEALQWWGIWIIALSVPFGWLTIVSPLAITCLLLFVSGVPLAEKRFEGRPGWDEYRQRTSRFLPFPPKKV